MIHSHDTSARRSLMSDLEGGLSSAAENTLGDETDDGGRRLLLSDSHVQPESETSGPSTADEDEDEAHICETAKSNKRYCVRGRF